MVCGKDDVSKNVSFCIILRLHDTNISESLSLAMKRSPGLLARIRSVLSSDFRKK